MIKLNIRAVVSLFCVLLVSFLFTGCSSEQQSEDKSADTALSSIVTTQVSETQSAPDTDGSDSGVDSDRTDIGKEIYNWDGAELVILTWSGEQGADIFGSPSDFGVYSRLVSERNDAIADTFGIKIKEQKVQKIRESVLDLSNANSAPSLVYSSGDGGMSELMMYGLLEDLYRYKDRIPSHVGASVSALRQLSIYGKLYMITGAPIRSSLESTTVCAYNVSAISTLGYERGYLEELALDGRWTYDTFSKLVKEYSGIGLSGAEDAMYSLWKGLGALTVEKSSGDEPEVSIYNPRNMYYFELVHSLYGDVGENETDVSSLFSIDTLANVKKKLNSDVSVLPVPMYHEGGEYTCMLDFGSTYFCAVPSAAENKAIALDYLDGMFSMSIDSVYENTVSDYNFGNSEVLDVILKARHFDFFDMYGIGHILKSAFSPQSETADFDALLSDRAKFADQALDIAIKQSVGVSTNR